MSLFFLRPVLLQKPERYRGFRKVDARAVTYKAAAGAILEKTPPCAGVNPEYWSTTCAILGTPPSPSLASTYFHPEVVKLRLTFIPFLLKAFFLFSPPKNETKRRVLTVPCCAFPSYTTVVLAKRATFKQASKMYTSNEVRNQTNDKQAGSVVLFKFSSCSLPLTLRYVALRYSALRFLNIFLPSLHF